MRCFLPGEAWITFGPMEPYKIKHEGGVVEEGSVATLVGSDGCNSLNGK